MKLDIIEVEILGLEVHKLASVHPFMDDCEFQSFKEDIKLNGQLEPIKLYKGKIIDGRHRRQALNEIAIEEGLGRISGSMGGFIKAVLLPHNTSLNEVKAIINSSEKRRMQTKTQLTAAAFKMASENPTITNKSAAKLKGVPVSNVNRCKRISDLLGNKAIDDLIAGKNVMVTTINGGFAETASIQFIYNTLGEAAKKEAETRTNRRMTPVDADKKARTYGKNLNKADANLLASAMQNYANSLLED